MASRSGPLVYRRFPNEPNPLVFDPAPAPDAPEFLEAHAEEYLELLRNFEGPIQ